MKNETKESKSKNKVSPKLKKQENLTKTPATVTKKPDEDGNKLKTSKAKQLLIDINNIHKSYGKHEVLKGINFKIYAGEKVAVVGANGTGKTTLSEILAKVKEQTKGEIKYYFEDDGKESIGKHKISQNIGIQFQDSSYPDFYKVNALVNFIVEAAGIEISEEKLNHLYEIFDLAKLKNSVANRLSGGQQQRLNILLAIINNPKLLILDEVGTGLDVESRTKIKSYIKSYANENEAAILLVSHNSDEVIELVERVIVIHNGLVYEDKPLKDILDQWKTFDNYMNNLYLNVFKKDLSLEALPRKRKRRKER